MRLHSNIIAGVLGVALGFSGQLAHAQTIDQTLSQACPDDRSNAEQRECMAQLSRRYEGELADVAQRILSYINATQYIPPDKKADWRVEFEATQRHWTDFKAHDCMAVTAYEWFGGSGAGLAVNTCLAKQTLTRILDLKARYHLK
jgi:uncharacterized protein YecT (DUF1311 family)